MLIRISLIVAILAGLAVGVGNFIKVKEKIVTLQTNLKAETDAKVKALAELKKTKSDLEKTKTELTQTQATLKATTEEKEKALAELDTQKKRGDKLSEDLTKARGERDDAQRELAAYKATGLTPPEIVSANKVIKNLQDSLSTSETENKVLLLKVNKLKNDLLAYQANPPPVLLPAKLLGKVLVSDPKWQFVVLSVGEDQGVLERGELLVNRDGKLVAKVKVSSVQKGRSVANVLPGWQLGEILEGDQVIPAYPES